MDYRDWQEKTYTLEFINVISCFMASPFNRPLSHCETEKNGNYIADCCRIAGEDATSPFLIFDFIDAWEGQRIVRIVAESMTKRQAVFRLRKSSFPAFDIENQFDPPFDKVGKYRDFNNFNDLLLELQYENVRFDDFIDAALDDEYPL